MIAALLSLFSSLAAVPRRPAPRLGPALAPGDPAPPLEGRTLSGDDLAVSWDAQKLALVSFWATWCVPCRDEMPVLQSLQARRAKDGLLVIGVELDRTSDEASRKFLADLGVTYPVLRGGAEISEQWGGIGILPTSFVVSAQGKLVRKYVGATPEQVRGLVADVEALLEGRPLGKIVEPARPAAVSR